jgi:type VI secretion system secreted protein VgrG
MIRGNEQYTQADRLLAIDTPLGKDVLLLQSLRGREAISRLFSYDLELLAYGNDSIRLSDIVGQKVTITIRLPDGTPRYINGYVSRFSQGATDERFFTRYYAQVVPWLWFLTRQADCRIFQNLSVPDIIAQVFSRFSFADFRSDLRGDYPSLEYCVQYRETTFNFVSRLLEEFGIFYYFDHSSEGRHTLVLTDSSAMLKECFSSPVSYEVAPGGLNDPSAVTTWHVAQELQTGKYSVTDYNFTTPSLSLLASDPTVVCVPPNDDLEIFDYPGLYSTPDQGSTVAKLRMQEEEATHLVITGSGNCRGFASGYTFQLQNHYRQDQNTSYLLTEVNHLASVGETYVADTTEGEHYSNQFTCIPASVTYRPRRVTPKPFVQGPQPALVVGKAGEEIWVDKYGRVKVQFYWDRQGQKDENSSCWIRVSQPWAGRGWGAMWIPRIGQEVIVSFLEGDPDRPIITGRVYNAEQMVPYALPDNQTRSTFMSRSSKGGSSSNYNEIRFEDKKDNEQIFINAERDMDLRVEHDSREYVGANRHLIVQASQYEAVGGDKHSRVKGSHVAEIEKDMQLEVVGDQKHAVDGNGSFFVLGDRKDAVGGKMSLLVGGDQVAQVNRNVSLEVLQSRNERVGMTHALEAGETIHLKAGMTVVIEAGMQLSLKGPGGFVDIGPAGVSIQGTMVLINSGGAAASGPGAQTQSPDQPDLPADPKSPETADDGSKGGKLN